MPVVAAAAIVADAGTVAALFAEDRAIESPPVGAALLMVSVPVDEVPPGTDAGFNVSDDRVGAVTVKFALAVLAPVPAVIAAVALVATAVVDTVNVAVDAAAATVTVAGTVAEALPELNGTDVPAVGAGPVRVTVPVDVVPPTTDVGLSARVVTTGALTVRVVFWVTPDNTAEMVTVVLVETAVVVAVNVALVAPAAIATEAGTVVEGSDEDRVTETPPVGAWPVSATVPADDVPPVTDVGMTLG